jgi:hypothetical protein
MDETAAYPLMPAPQAILDGARMSPEPNRHSPASPAKDISHEAALFDTIAYSRVVVRCWFRHIWISRRTLWDSLRASLRRSRVERNQRRRTPSFRPILENLENREMLDAAPNALASSAILSDLGQLRNDMAVSSATLVNVSNNSPLREMVRQDLDVFAHSPLGQAIAVAENRFDQSVASAEQLFDTLLYDVESLLHLNTQPASKPSEPVSPRNGALTPGGDPPLPFVEGATPTQQLITTFTDSDGNTNPSQYSASINWGNGQNTPGTVQYDANSGQFQVWGGTMYAEEGSYPISVTINDQDGYQTTATASAAVSDAALTTGAVYGLSATVGQAYNSPFVNFTDANASAAASDFTAQIDWGDGQIAAGTVAAQGNGTFTVGGNHTYALPGTYAVNVAISDIGGSETSASTSATVAASTTAPAAYNDAYSLNHDSTLTVSAASGVLANDTDPNNLPLSAVLVGNAAHGNLQFNSDGSFTYTPNAGYTGPDSFSYYASDGQYNSNTATATLTVDSTISGQVWLDGNQDGIENNGESGMSGVTVNLVAPTGYQLSSTTTDANGNYQLSVDPSLGSQFQVQVAIPSGDSATIPFASQTGIVSSINDAGYSNLLTLPSSGGISNVNAGIATGNGPLATLSGEVWLDSNDNGTLDSGEPGLQAINVNLLDNNLNVVDSTVTDANGAYSFLGLTPNSPYTVQFVAANGYVFSPQNVGSPSTSSAAGANGSTNPITLSPGQNDTTVNAGLYGSAPIDYQTNVSMTAENDSYTGIDFTADGYSPGGATLTPVIVQGPTYGSLVYNTSTGLYDYTAPSNYTGLDSFQFELSDGHAVSAVVTVQVLAYNGIIQPGLYNNFPNLETALFDGNGGQPSQSSISVGDISACWFVAAAAGLAQQNPNAIVNMVKYNAGLDIYVVTFPGQKATTITGFEHDANAYSTANGDWLAALEKGYGQMIYNQKWATWGNTPYDYINRGETRNTGIEALTGHSTTTNKFKWTKDSTTRTNLTNAFANKKVVVAGTGGSSLSDAELEAMGLVSHHSYTVVTYDATTDQVRLFNPWGKNPVFDNGTDPAFFLGKNDAENPTHAQNGYFWMKLSDFTKAFSGIAYED